MSTMGNDWKQSGPLPEQKKISMKEKIFGPSGTTPGKKRKFEHSKPTVPAKRVKKQYTAKEKAYYQKKKAGERKVKKEWSVAPAGEIRHKA